MSIYDASNSLNHKLEAHPACDMPAESLQIQFSSSLLLGPALATANMVGIMWRQW